LSISIHSRGLHLCRCIHACDCPALHQYVGERIHVAVTWTLPSQSAQNCSVGYPDHTIRGEPYRFIYHLTDFFEGRDIQSGDQLVMKLVLGKEKARIQLRYLFDDIDVSDHAEFPELVPKYRSVESELSSPGRL